MHIEDVIDDDDALLARRPARPAASAVNDSSSSSGGDGAVAAADTDGFDSSSFDVAGVLGLGADDDDSALSADEKKRLARLLGGPMDLSALTAAA